jgi:hypothetical protein
MASSKTHSDTSFDVTELVELVVHVPPRGKRAAFITMRTETGPLERRIELDNSMIVKIMEVILSRR